MAQGVGPDAILPARFERGIPRFTRCSTSSRPVVRPTEDFCRHKRDFARHSSFTTSQRRDIGKALASKDHVSHVSGAFNGHSLSE